MPDGVDLLADRWAPRTGGESLPTALYRCPYGRRGVYGLVLCRMLAERGFQVLIQSTRGTFGSGGVFDPMRHERDDGLATVEWLVRQPWFGGSAVLLGPSYLGYVQWAIADRLPPQVKAMIPQVTESALTLEFLRKDGLSLETPFGWGIMTDGQERRGALLRQLRFRPQECSRDAHAAAGSGRCDGRGAPRRIHPRHPHARRGFTALGRDRPQPPRGRGHRAGQLHRRLVRHLLARPTARLPNIAGRGAAPAAHDRTVDTYRAGRVRASGVDRIRTGPCAR